MRTQGEGQWKETTSFEMVSSWSEWRDSFASAPKTAQIKERLGQVLAGGAHPCRIWLFESLARMNEKREAKSLPFMIGPSGETRTRGILVPKSGQNLYIVYSLFRDGFSQIILISKNFFHTQYFYFRHISGQISGHKSALPSKRNRSSTEKIASK